jgi:hypothetical protein
MRRAVDSTPNDSNWPVVMTDGMLTRQCGGYRCRRNPSWALREHDSGGRIVVISATSLEVLTCRGRS